MKDKKHRNDTIMVIAQRRKIDKKAKADKLKK
jgi:hypothetical protein